MWEGEVHEVIAPRGNIQYADIGITHKKPAAGDPDRNLRIYEKLLKSGKLLEPRQRFYYARELVFHQRWQEAEAELRRFLEEGGGWVENNIDACRQLALCRAQQNDGAGELDALFHSFVYDLPRAEVCCDIGCCLMRREDWRRAAYWYRLALGCERRDTAGGFVQPDCYDYIPALQLCVCCDRLGDRQQAIAYNELAEKAKPNSAACRYNKRYFEETSDQ